VGVKTGEKPLGLIRDLPFTTPLMRAIVLDGLL
jgi:hypothetical protein